MTDHKLSDEHQLRKDEAEVAKAEAEARSAATKADREAADARAAQLAGLVPDLSKVERNSLEVKDGPAMLSSALTYRALQIAAASVQKALAAHGVQRVLVTSEPDLASADAGYRDITSGLDALDAAAVTLLPVTQEQQPEKPGGDEVAIAVAAQVAATVVAAIPAVLSLFSTQRTVRTAPVTVTDLAAATAVAGAIRSATATVVVHDDFRLAHGNVVYAKATAVDGRRQQLVAQKITLADQKSVDAALLTIAQADLKHATETTPDDQGKITAARDEVKRLTVAVHHSSVRIGQIESLVTAIDTFTTAVRTVPAGAARSALAAAALHEQLRGDNKFGHVLLIKAEAGQAQQVTENRMLRDDRFSTFVDANLMYMLIETEGSSVVAAGTVSGTATARGKIGEPPTFT
jgi:hypothetical protein